MDGKPLVPNPMPNMINDSKSQRVVEALSDSPISRRLTSEFRAQLPSPNSVRNTAAVRALQAPQLNGETKKLARQLLFAANVDLIRQKARQARCLPDPKVEVESDPLDLSVERELLDTLREALIELAERSPRTAHVLSLRFLEGCTLQETSARVGVALVTVQREIARGLSFLQKQLGE